MAESKKETRAKTEPTETRAEPAPKKRGETTEESTELAPKRGDAFGDSADLRDKYLRRQYLVTDYLTNDAPREDDK